MSSSRAVCIHGHFYQPPRENPWLEAIEQQDSAYPMHDWNERVHVECYRNNAASRVLDREGRVRAIVNNYARISFNIGPTLLSWMEKEDPHTYGAILAADRASRARFGGHGSAMAQVYNHIIMPLASRRDKVTQVRWGIADFRRRFERFPEGMWLAETAVDTESLEVLAEHGIAFTLLAPGQAARVRLSGKERWQEVGPAVDPRRPYLVNLPSGRSITVFFYDGGLSQAVAFQGLLGSGDRFAEALLTGFDERTEPQLVHIATDGESYGHHHRHGDMALAYALERIDAQPGVELTNYGEFLAQHPPVWEAEIIDNTSWSCFHGVERWRSDCGCRLDSRAGTNQRWREPLRKALDTLRDRTVALCDERGRQFLRDPWKARDEYIRVIADRDARIVDGFIAEHATEEGQRDVVSTLRLLELMRHALLMYTSCGWFFDDVSRIETVQVLAYAGRVLDLARDLGGEDWEEELLAELEQARSNFPEEGNGRQVYDRYVRPARVDRPKLIAHYAVSSIFDPYAEDAQIYAYDVEQHAYEAVRVGLGTLAVGHAKVTSRVTRAGGEYAFAVWHFGDHNLIARVQPFTREHFETIQKRLIDSARRGDAPVLLREIEHGFSGPHYSLRSLLRDQQRKVMAMVLANTEAELSTISSQLYDRFAPLARFLGAARFPLPKPLQAAAEFVLNTTLRTVCDTEPLDVNRVQSLLEEAHAAQVALDKAGLGLALQNTLERAAQRWEAQPDSEEALEEFARAAQLLRSLPFQIDLFVPQNLLYRQLRRLDPEAVDTQGGWWQHLREAAEALHMALPDLASPAMEQLPDPLSGNHLG